MSGLLFPPELEPQVRHPDVKALGAEATEALLGRALARYLSDTVWLERQIVNPVAEWLATGAERFRFDHKVRHAAGRLHAEEEQHAAESAALIRGLGLAPVDERPAFAAALEAVENAQEDVSTRRLVRFWFVVVTETTVTDRLRTIGADERIEPSVRAFVTEHARDEAWHAAFFKARCAEVWTQLSEEEKRHHGSLLPALVAAYLSPDLSAVAADLCSVGLSAEHSSAVLDSAYSDTAVRASMARAAGSVMACFDAGGLWQHPPTRAAFEAAGMV